jgi:hypothetical protein
LFLDKQGARAVKRDREHLKLLVIFHYVLAVLVFGIASIFIFHFVMGILIVSGKIPSPPGQPGPPAFMGWFLLGMGAFVLFMGYSLAICLVSAAVCLSRRKAHTFCCIVAGLSCMWAPLGTALGVCSLIVLLRPTVKDLFAGRIVEHDDYDEDEEEPIRPAREDLPEREDERARPTRDDDRFSERR